MNLKQYIAESERTFTYRLKTIVPLDDYAMDRIEQVCMRHNPVGISRPRKTIMQKNPIDFKNIEHAEVWIVDFEFALPVSSYVLGEQIRHALAAHEMHVLVRGTNDPNEVESERLVAASELNDEAARKGLKPDGLLNDDEYSEVEAKDGDEFYGKKHNERLLDYLATVQKEREAASKVDPKSPLFKWIDMPKLPEDDAEYNADIPDAPRLGKANGSTGYDETVSDKGILTDRKKVYKRQYGKDGTHVSLRKEVDTRKDPK